MRILAEGAGIEKGRFTYQIRMCEPPFLFWIRQDACLYGCGQGLRFFCSPLRYLYIVIKCFVFPEHNQRQYYSQSFCNRNGKPDTVDTQNIG